MNEQQIANAIGALSADVQERLAITALVIDQLIPDGSPRFRERYEAIWKERNQPQVVVPENVVTTDMLVQVLDKFQEGLTAQVTESLDGTRETILRAVFEMTHPVVVPEVMALPEESEVHHGLHGAPPVHTNSPFAAMAAGGSRAPVMEEAPSGGSARKVEPANDKPTPVKAGKK